jgi:hypothetical protein
MGVLAHRLGADSGYARRNLVDRIVQAQNALQAAVGIVWFAPAPPRRSSRMPMRHSLSKDPNGLSLQ